MARGSGVEGRCGDEGADVVGALNGSGVGARAADDGAPLTSWSKGEVMVFFSQFIETKCDRPNQRPWRPSAVVMAGQRGQGGRRRSEGEETQIAATSSLPPFPLFSNFVYSFFLRFALELLDLVDSPFLYTRLRPEFPRGGLLVQSILFGRLPSAVYPSDSCGSTYAPGCLSGLSGVADFVSGPSSSVLNNP